MCTTCTKIKKLPSAQAIEAALYAIAARLAKTGHSAQCLDDLLGKLIGEPTPEVDRDTELAWENRRGGR